MTKTKKTSNDKTQNYTALSLIAIGAIMLIFNPSLTHATLIGDEVTITLAGADTNNNLDAPDVTDTVIEGQEPNFLWNDVGCGSDDGVFVDVGSSTIVVNVGAGFGNSDICDTSSNSIDNPLDFTIADLDWVDFPGSFLSGIVVTSNDSSLTTTQEVTGFDSAQITVDSYSTTGGIVEFTLEKTLVMTASKSWTHTDYNWDPICDGFVNPADDLCYEDEGYTIPSEFRQANINNNGENSDPDDDVLADPLPITTVEDTDKFTAFAQVHKNDKFSNTNPGAFYALTTVVVTSSISSVEVFENYDDCTNEDPADGELGLEIHNKKKLDRSIKAAVADPEGNVTEISDYLYDNDLISSVNNFEDSALIEINQEIEAGSTVFVLVKFQDDLRGYDTEDGIFDGMCHNVETVTAHIGENQVSVDAEADLRITNVE
jgi:hypothetical protein